MPSQLQVYTWKGEIFKITSQFQEFSMARIISMADIEQRTLCYHIYITEVCIATRSKICIFFFVSTFRLMARGIEKDRTLVASWKTQTWFSVMNALRQTSSSLNSPLYSENYADTCFDQVTKRRIRLSIHQSRWCAYLAPIQHIPQLVRADPDKIIKQIVKNYFVLFPDSAVRCNLIGDLLGLVWIQNKPFTSQGIKTGHETRDFLRGQTSGVLCGFNNWARCGWRTRSCRKSHGRAKGFWQSRKKLLLTLFNELSLNGSRVVITYLWISIILLSMAVATCSSGRRGILHIIRHMSPAWDACWTIIRLNKTQLSLWRTKHARSLTQQNRWFPCSTTSHTSWGNFRSDLEVDASWAQLGADYSFPHRIASMRLDTRPGLRKRRHFVRWIYAWSRHTAA